MFYDFWFLQLWRKVKQKTWNSDYQNTEKDYHFHDLIVFFPDYALLSHFISFGGSQPTRVASCQ
jgi:hypothetical protein